MIRPNGRYPRFTGKTKVFWGETYVHLGDLLTWLLDIFKLHIRWARQIQADEIDAITDALDEARPEPTDDDE